MSRPAMIAGTVVGAGVLAVAAVSGVALIRAGQSTPPESTVAIAPSIEPAPATLDPLPPVPSLAPMTEPSAPAASLPAAPVAPEAPAQAPTQPVAASTPAPQAPATVGKRAARAAVLAQTSGTVLNIASTVHQGTDAWAVTVSRSDGSIVTGYVDTIGGVVFDWSVERAAKPATGSAGNSGGEGGEHEGGEHEGGEHEGGDDD